MGGGPGLSFLAVEARANDVQEEDDGADGEDGALELELAEGVTLVDVVPLRKRTSRGLGRAAERRAARGSRKGAGHGRRISSTGEICEVCMRAMIASV